MIRLGVLCAADIAYRRFMPALLKIPGFRFIGVAVNSREERFGSENLDAKGFPANEQRAETIRRSRRKAQRFADTYGGKVFGSYEELVTSGEADAVYIPLPPALHFRWAKEALTRGKHVMVEKPAVLDAYEAGELVKIASDNHLAFCENYMFAFHSQIGAIRELIGSGKIGEPRLFRLAFGFPLRGGRRFPI